MNRHSGGRREVTRGKKMEVAAVLSTQRTEGGAQVEQLRKEEETLASQSGYRVKIVERVRNKLEETLTRSDPYSGGDCGRSDCYPCLTKAVSLKWKPCWRCNITYKAVCSRCKEEGFHSEYIGE